MRRPVSKFYREKIIERKKRETTQRERREIGRRMEEDRKRIGGIILVLLEGDRKGIGRG